jgi:Transcriptional regulators
VQSRYSAPPLTTVDVPVDLMMREVVRYIDRHLAEKSPLKPEKERFVYPCSLVVRESCGVHLRNPLSKSLTP